MTALLYMQGRVGSQVSPFLEFYLEDTELGYLLTLENCASQLPLLMVKVFGIL